MSMAGFLGMFSSVLQQRTANGVETLKVESNIPNVHSFTISHIIHVPHICQHVCHFRCRCSSIYVMNTYSVDFRRIKSYKIYTQIFANPSLLVLLLMIYFGTLFYNVTPAPGADLAEQIRSKGSWKAALQLLVPELQKRQPVETGQPRVGQMRPKLNMSYGQYSWLIIINSG